MDYKEVAFRAIEESDNLIYVSDVETYKLLYLNKAARVSFNIGESQYEGELCYKMLQNLEHPCEFCTNHLLCEERFHVWKHYNGLLGKYYHLKDKLIEINGRKYRMEICIDITENELEEQRLKSKLSTEETLVSCIQTLSGGDDVDIAINSLLAIIGEFYQGERTYIFEFNRELELLCNSYEWCKEGVEPQIDNLKNLPMSVADRWVEQFYHEGEFYITSLGKNVNQDTEEYKILNAQNIESLMAAPIWEDDKVSGFIGVDNPGRGEDNIRLLKSISYFVKNDIDKRKMILDLQKSSFKDALTGLGNRNNFIETINQIGQGTPDSLGVAFIDINGLKRANDEIGHEYGDRMILSVAEGMKKYFYENAYRIGGDEFVGILVDISEEEFQDRIQKMKDYENETCICDFSMGVNFRKGDVDILKQIRLCDSMMYIEKKEYYEKSSKNRRSKRADNEAQSVEKRNFI